MGCWGPASFLLFIAVTLKVISKKPAYKGRECNPRRVDVRVWWLQIWRGWAAVWLNNFWKGCVTNGCWGAAWKVTTWKRIKSHYYTIGYGLPFTRNAHFYDILGWLGKLVTITQLVASASCSERTFSAAPSQYRAVRVGATQTGRLYCMCVVFCGLQPAIIGFYKGREDVNSDEEGSTQFGSKQSLGWRWLCDFKWPNIFSFSCLLGITFSWIFCPY